MSDATGLHLLADEITLIATAVPGVVRVQARPGLGRFARRVVTGLAGGPSAPAPPSIVVTVGAMKTTVEIDLVIASAHSAPEVARAVASNVLARLSLEGLPEPTVDVRVVSVV